MATTDRLFDAEFPHGTPRGWDLGCRGGICPNRGTEWPTCSEAHRRYAGDYAFRRDVDAGLKPRALGAPALAADPPATRPRPAPAFSRAQAAAERTLARDLAQLERADPDVAAAAAKVDAVRPSSTTSGRQLVPHPVVGADGRRHGTMTGYSRGCRKGSDCPATPSCFEVAMDYYSARRRDKRAAAADGAPALAVVAIVQPDPPGPAVIPMPPDPGRSVDALAAAADSRVVEDILAERVRQRTKHGDQRHLPDGTGPESRPLVAVIRPGPRSAGGDTVARVLRDLARADTDRAAANGGDGTVTWRHVFLEEAFEALAEGDPVLLRAEIVQTAAVLVQWAGAIDSRTD